MSDDLRTDQLAPHSIEAEEAVLGSILISAEAIYEVMSFLQPADYFIVRHSWIFEAMLSLLERKQPIDYLTIVNELEQMGRLAEIGGASYILSLVNKTPSALNVEGYGHIVEDMAIRRRLLDAASQIARVAHSDETDINTVTGKSEQLIFDVTRKTKSFNTYNSAQLASHIYDKTSAKLRPDYIDTGIRTYQTSVDRIIRSFQPGHFILIGGRPGMGKTSWMLSVLAENARHGVKGGLLTLEMSAEEVGTRFMAAECNIPYRTILDGELNPDNGEIDRFLAATDAFSSWQLPIDDTAGLNPFDVRTILRRMVYEHHIEFACIDYIQLMNGGAGYAGKDSRVNEISFISRALKQIAKELQIPILAGSQLSRGVEARKNKRPMMSDLRESGSLEQDTDYVIFPYRDSYYDAHSSKGNVTEINVAKNRHGKTGVAEVVFLDTQMKFGDLAPEYRQKQQPPIQAYKPAPAIPLIGNMKGADHTRVYRGDRDDS